MRLVNVANPISAQDVATKDYVDDNSGGGAPWIQTGTCSRGPNSYVDYFIACDYRVCNPSGCSAWYTGSNRMVRPYVAPGYWS